MSDNNSFVEFLGKMGRYTNDVLAPPGAGIIAYGLSNHNPYIALISGSLTAAAVLINEFSRLIFRCRSRN